MDVGTAQSSLVMFAYIQHNPTTAHRVPPQPDILQVTVRMSVTLGLTFGVRNRIRCFLQFVLFIDFGKHWLLAIFQMVCSTRLLNVEGVKTLRRAFTS